MLLLLLSYSLPSLSVEYNNLSFFYDLVNWVLGDVHILVCKFWVDIAKECHSLLYL